MPASRTPYQLTPLTTADLPWADLATLKLSDFDLPGGKQRLATQLKEAIHTVGFFYISDFGIDQADVDAQFALAQDLFALPCEEKMKVAVDKSLPGGPLGYKPAGTISTGRGTTDTFEIYDDPKYNSHFERRLRPSAIEETRAMNEKFNKHLHDHVLYRLLVLAAIVLELEDEEALWRMHNYSAMSNCHMRYMVMRPRPEEEVKIMDGKQGIPGHTDFGSFTLLFMQPIAALQVRLDPTNRAPDAPEEWKWVKPIPGTITVNVADTLSFLTGGYLKSSVHRVVMPPEDQRHLSRYSVIYFSRPDDETKLEAVESPVIKRVGNNAGVPPAGAESAGDWVQLRYNNIPSQYNKATISLVSGSTVTVK